MRDLKLRDKRNELQARRVVSLDVIPETSVCVCVDGSRFWMLSGRNAVH